MVLHQTLAFDRVRPETPPLATGYPKTSVVISGLSLFPRPTREVVRRTRTRRRRGPVFDDVRVEQWQVVSPRRPRLPARSIQRAVGCPGHAVTRTLASERAPVPGFGTTGVSDAIEFIHCTVSAHAMIAFRWSR